MAILKPGSTVGGNLILHQGMLPLYPDKDSIYYKNFKIYTQYDKPTNVDVGLGNVTNDAQVKKAGDTMTGNLTIDSGINSALLIKKAILRADQNSSLVLSAPSQSIYFRPNGDTDTRGQMSLASGGALSVDHVLATGAQNGSINALTRKDYVDGKLVDLDTKLDNKKVNRAGDTMTGELTVPKLKSTGNVEAAGAIKVWDNLSLERHGGDTYQTQIIKYGQDTDDLLLFRMYFKDGYRDVVQMATNKINGITNVNFLHNIKSDYARAKWMGINTDSDLGAGSIAIGDSDTGLKWREDGWIDTYSNNVVVSSVAGSQNFFNRQVTIRFRSDGAGNVNGLAPAGTSLLKIDTTTDGNGTGDGYSYIGLSNAGKYHNYLRGTGATFIDSVDGLRVSGQTHPLAGIVTSGKSVGTYDIYSMVNWSQDTQAFNRLRHFRACGASTWWHELVWGHHDNPKYSDSLTWWQGIGTDNWIASLHQSGNFKTNRFEAYGGGPTYKLISSTDGSSYISGQNDGKENSWLLGKIDAGTNIMFQNNMVTGQSSAVALRQNHVQLYANGYNTLTVLDNRIEIDGSRWAATNSHAWSDQWNQLPPVLLNFGTSSGASDYYPGFALQQTTSQAGYHTRVEMGMIREGNQYGRGVLRVSEHSYASNAGKFAAQYFFDINGKFSTNRMHSFAVGDIDNALAGWSIAIGDSDTGIKWESDGVYNLFANSQAILQIHPNYITTHTGKSIISNGDLNQANDAHSTYVRDIYIRSDIRVKTDLKEFDKPSETLSKMQGYLYLQKKGFKEDGSINWEQSAGLIAQEVQNVLPELISVDKDNPEGLLRLNYNGIIALNTAAINEHTSEIEALRKENKNLRERFDRLEKLLSK